MLYDSGTTLCTLARWRLERFTQLELLGLGHIELELRPRPEFESIDLWHSRRGLPLATPAGAAVQPEVVKCSDLYSYIRKMISKSAWSGNSNLENIPGNSSCQNKRSDAADLKKTRNKSLRLPSHGLPHGKAAA